MDQVGLLSSWSSGENKWKDLIETKLKVDGLNWDNWKFMDQIKIKSKFRDQLWYLL